jgi:hypothetical protein
VFVFALPVDAVFLSFFRPVNPVYVFAASATRLMIAQCLIPGRKSVTDCLILAQSIHQ